MTPDNADDRARAFLRERRWFATITVNLAMIASIMSSTMINVALPDIMGAHGVGQDIAHWLSTGFISAQTVCMLVAAWMVARIGPRYTYLTAIVVFVLASFLGLQGTSIETLILARVLQGSAAGMLQPLTLTIIFAAFPPEQRGKAMGIFAMGVVLGPAFGPFFGGIIIDQMSWPYVFVGAVPLLILGGALAFSTLPRKIPDLVPQRFNWLSFALVTLAVAMFLTSLSNGQRLGWNSEQIVLGFVVAILSACAFVLWELVTKTPLLQVRLFADPRFSLAAVVAFVFGAGMFSSFYILPLYARTVQEFTPTKAGLMLMPAGLLLLFVFPLAGWLAQRSARGPVLGGLVLFGGSMLLFHDADANTALLFFITVTMIGRAGLGFVMPAINLHALRTLPDEFLAFGAGTFTFVRMLGASIGTNAVAIYIARRTDTHVEWLKATQTADNAMTAEFMLGIDDYLAQAGLAGIEHAASGIGHLRRVIEWQANVGAYQDAFVAVGLVFALGLIPALFLGRGARAPESAAGRPGAPRAESSRA